MRQRWMSGICLLALVVAGLLLLVGHFHVAGWIVWAAGLGCLALTTRAFAKHLILIFGALGILGLIPINTSITAGHIALMGSALLVAVVGPYLISRFVYKEDAIQYPLTNGWWKWWHYGYIALTVFLAYLILPFWMQNTGGYLNWTVPLSPQGLFVLFLGTNGLGIWDELFFIVTCLALLRKHLPFVWANLVQATIFTSFLYDLGFRGWAPALIFPFALLQGLVFKRTHSLLYIIAIHLSLDLVLYLALINAHYPQLINIFITR